MRHKLDEVCSLLHDLTASHLAKCPNKSSCTRATVCDRSEDVKTSHALGPPAKIHVTRCEQVHEPVHNFHLHLQIVARFRKVLCMIACSIVFFTSSSPSTWLVTISHSLWYNIAFWNCFISLLLSLLSSPDAHVMN